MSQAWVDLDGDPAVDAAGTLVDLGEDVAGVADVVGGDGPDGGVHVGAALGQFSDLRVVRVARGQRRLEDRRVGGDTDDAVGVPQFGQVARVQPAAGQV